jgi:hypothetical protein
MLVFSVGLPGPTVEWCDAVLARIVERAFGSVERIDANRLSEIGLGVLRAASSHFVVSSRRPTARIGAAVGAAGRRTILVLDNPLVALHQLVTRDGVGMVDAVRAVASGCASMVEFTNAPGALLLDASTEPFDPERAATAIIRYLELELPAGEIAEIARRHDDWMTNCQLISPAAWWAELDERDRRLASGAIEGYTKYFAGEALSGMIWEPDLFRIEAERQAAGSLQTLRSVDITGRSRCLISGPSVMLPSGSWAAHFTVALSSEAAEMGYLVEISAGLPLTSTRIEPHSGPHVELTLDFTTDTSLEAPVEIRIWNERAAFDGELILGPVTLTPRQNSDATDK